MLQSLKNGLVAQIVHAHMSGFKCVNNNDSAV
jgi:hypothetical protein